MKSENFISKNVMEIADTVLTNKCTERHPDQRYYDGFEFKDEVETLA